MHKFNGTMGFQRLIKELKRDTGGGPPGPDSVSSSTIVNGQVGEVDIADGAITQAKFAPAVLLAFATFSQQLFNLEQPGFWGSLRIKNSNTSDNGATMTITVQSEYFDNPTQNTDIIVRLTSTTITKGNHVDIPITIDLRLTNKDTIIKMYYTINKDTIQSVSNSGIQVDDQGSDIVGNYISMIFFGDYADFNNGSAEIEFGVND